MTENKEIRVNTTYGKIAIKVWGNESNHKIKVLCVHGWMDNAGSFDRLLPLLDLDKMYVMCVDLPGHGLSSHLPPGGVYTDITWVMELKRVVDHFNWSKFTFLSHSMGANASLHFAVLFPELVERVITLDTVKPAVFPSNELAYRTAQDINKFLELEERNEIRGKRDPIFTYDGAISALKSAHSVIGALTAEGCACLLKRATRVTPNHAPNGGYIFTRDSRLQCVINRKMDCRYLFDYFSAIKCELMIINAKNGLFTDKELQKQFLEMYSDRCKKFVYVEVEGDHYAHLTRPQNVAPHVRQFLSEAIGETNGSV